VGTFEFDPYVAAIAAFVMIFAAAYLLWMYQRIIFGEVSDFLKSLGDHLTDMTPVEILTLAPLAALTVIFGIQPGLLLNLFPSTVTATLQSAQTAAPIAIPTTVAVGALVLLLVLVAARIAWVLLRPRQPALETEGGAAH